MPGDYLHEFVLPSRQNKKTYHGNQLYSNKMDNDHHDDGDASVAARSVGEDDSIYQSNTHVIVVGGGPAGLLTAILLRQRGIRVTVLEKMAAQDTWSSRSYSINLNYRGRNALFEAGVLDEVIEVASQRDEIVVHDGITGRITTIIPKHPPDVAVSRPDLTLQLERVLLEKYRTKIRRGARVSDLVLNRKDDKVEVVLEDGASYLGTHLVGADGKWSAVREKVPYFVQQASMRTESSWGVHMTASELPANWCKHSALIYKPRKEAKFYVICAPLPSGTCSITMVCYDDTLKQYPWLKPPRDSQQSWTNEQWKRNHLSMENDSDGVIRVELAEKLEEMFQVEMPGFLKAGIDKKTLQTATIHPRVSWLDMNLPQNEIDTVGGSRRNDDGVKLERENSFVTGDAKYSTPGGGIVLVGDSCHACTASLGQGCNLALESAMALANSIDEIYSPSSSLETISVDDLSTAFSNYGETRPEVARPIQTASSAASKLSHKW